MTRQRTRGMLPFALLVVLTAVCNAISPSAAAAPAVQGEPDPPQPEATTIFWPLSPDFGGGGPLREIVTGDLTGDLAADAVVIDGNRTVFLYGVDTYSARSELTSPTLQVLDMAVMPGSERDTLFTTSTLGLLRHDFDPVTATFVHSIESNVRWRSARHVRVRDLDHQDGPDLVGIASEGHSLLTRFADGSGGFTPGYTVYFQDILEGLEIADWDHDGEFEIAGLSGAGLEVFEQTGGDPTFFAANHPGGFLASMRRLGGGGCLCWVGRDPTDSHYVLRTITADGEYAPQALLFPPDNGFTPVPVDVVGLRVEDIDGDGFDDLLIAHSTFQRAIVLINRWTSGLSPFHPFSVQSGGYEYYDLSEEPLHALPSGPAKPAFSDIDEDDYADIVYPMDDAPRRVRVLTDLAPEGDDEFTGGEDILLLAEYGPDPVNPVAQLHLFLEIPPAILSGPWDHAQVILWKQNDEEPLLKDRVDNVLYELLSLPAGGQQDARHQKLVVDVPGESLDVPWTGPDRNYYVDLRFVVAHPGTPPTVSLSTRSLMHGWRISDNLDLQPYGPYADYLTELPSAGLKVPIMHIGTYLNPPGGVIIGIDVPLGRVPNHGEQEVPNPGSPNEQIKSALFW